MIFPVSSIILEQLDEYRQSLEAFSKDRLDLVKWRPDESNNVEVLNETIDLYRYFDATKQAEFLYSGVKETIEDTIPAEVDYLQKYDLMKDYLDNYFEMPDKTIALLIRFLEQGKGQLSEREVLRIQEKYEHVFL